MNLINSTNYYKDFSTKTAADLLKAKKRNHHLDKGKGNGNAGRAWKKRSYAKFKFEKNYVRLINMTIVSTWKIFGLSQRLTIHSKYILP